MGRLDSIAPWVHPLPSVSLVTDASDWGWGFQTSLGHQGFGHWEGDWQLLDINVCELQSVYIALSRLPSLTGQSIQVLSDNAAAVHCINRQGSSRSRAVLKVSEALLGLAAVRRTHLLASHLEGSENSWEDALSRNDLAAVD